MPRRVPVALVAVLAAAGLAAPPAASAAAPDASCSSPSAAVAGQPANNRGAQTFTAQNTGALTRAQVEIDKIGSPGDWILSINAVDGSGIPTNTVLGTTTIPDSSVPNGVGTLTADFAAPAAVTAGHQYAVVFTRPTSDPLRIRYSIVNACPGDAWFSFSQTGPFEYVCVNPNVCDLVFAVFVEPPPGAPGPGQQQAPLTKKKCKKKKHKHSAESAKKKPCKKKKHKHSAESAKKKPCKKKKRPAA